MGEGPVLASRAALGEVANTGGWGRAAGTLAEGDDGILVGGSGEWCALEELMIEENPGRRTWVWSHSSGAYPISH